MQTIQALGPRLGVAPTCRALGLPRATYYRGQHPARPPRPRRAGRALAPTERQAVLAALHEPRFVDLAPAEVYATLLDEGQYLCSERTMYRVLAAHHESPATPALRGPRAPRDGAQPAVELGYHQAARAGEVDVLLPVCDARHL